MESAIIDFRKNVTEYLNDLISVLFKDDYFGFEDSAFNYVNKIYDFIEYNLPIFPSKKTPVNLLYLGSKYIFYKANSNTTWYIFFEQSDKRFLVTFITNSHSEIVKHL